MDASIISANISLLDGSKRDIGSDVVLFHELVHVYLDLEGLDNSEDTASFHEGTYGNYNRYYLGGAMFKW